MESMLANLIGSAVVVVALLIAALLAVFSLDVAAWRQPARRKSQPINQPGRDAGLADFPAVAAEDDHAQRI